MVLGVEGLSDRAERPLDLSDDLGLTQLSRLGVAVLAIGDLEPDVEQLDDLASDAGVLAQGAATANGVGLAGSAGSTRITPPACVTQSIPSESAVIPFGLL